VDFPIPEGISGITSWKELRNFFKKVPKPATPEVLIPPELLYPWASPKPEDIEYLLEDDPKVTINQEKIKKIIRSCLDQPRMIPTLTDFLLTQTNTKMACVGNSIDDINKCHRNKKKLTSYKYELIPQ
jgi:hypothetical protein